MLPGGRSPPVEGPGTPPERAIVEREHELARIGELVGEVRLGRGRALLILGPAGIGKSALCACARSIAERAGLRVLSARGEELERELSFGLARQLLPGAGLEGVGLERVGTGLTDAGLEREQAGLEPVGEGLERVGAGFERVGEGEDRSMRSILALHQATLAACARGPLLLIADDCHWADAASLRWLLYLAARLRELPVGLLVSWREGEEGAIARWPFRLERQGGCEVLVPAPLSGAGTAAVLASLLGGAPPDALVHACRVASGGNPLLLGELARALRADGALPQAEEAVRRVRELGPRTVAHSLALRLGRLGAPAVELVRAAAVLGDGAGARECGALSGLPLERVLLLCDALSDAGILCPGPPLRFVHPIVRQAIYLDLPEGARRLAHRRAADVLARAGAEPERLCAHLLRSEPEGSSAVVGMLRAGARQALARGAPESAAAYLSRALSEGVPRRLRVALLQELGRVERLARDPRAAAHLREAMAEQRDPLARAALAGELAELLGLAGAWDEAHAVLAEALAQLRGEHAGAALELRARLEAYHVGLLAYDPDRARELGPRLAELVALSRGPRTSMRVLAAALAQLLAWRGDDLREADRLLAHALGEPRPAALVESQPLLAMRTLAAARLLDREPVTERLTAQLLEEARARGSVLARVMALAHRAGLRSRRGELPGAEADLRAVAALCQEHAVGFALPSALWLAADALIERPQLDDVAALAGRLELAPDLARTASGALLAEVRGRLALARHELPSARAELEAAARTYRALGLLSPAASPWCSELALALAAEDRAQARGLALEERRRARRLGLRRAEAVALRALGLIEGGERGRALLAAALRLAAESGAPLEQARALIELGGALRRANRRAAAREPLRLALDLGHRLGAGRLAERARTELAATGARPRRAALRGAEALTPAERRVAELAAHGLSNPQIAAALFITVNTVEAHLRHAYQKLSIRSRGELGPALAGGEARAPGEKTTVPP